MKSPEQLVNEFFAQVWSPPNNLDAIDDLMTEDYRITTAGKVISGRDNFKAWVKDFHAVLLDAKNISLDLFADPGQTKVVSRWVCSGRNNGIMGTKADLAEISFSGIAIWHVRDNRLAECWVERSALELYRQLTA